MPYSPTPQKKRRDRAKLWQDPDLAGIDILHAHYFTHSFSRHTHDGFAISIIEGGVGAFWYQGSVHASPAGYLGLLNPGEPHTGQVLSKAGWKYRALYVAPTVLQRVATEIADRSWSNCWFPEPIVYDPQLAQTMRTLHQLLSETSSRLERETVLLSVLAQVLTRQAQNAPHVKHLEQEHWAVKQVREYIEAHYASNISLQQLAQLVDLNPFHLAQVFCTTVGLPPHTYLNQVRVHQAKRLILAGEAIAQAAYLTGFVDQSHLTRRFKQILGCTPGQLLNR